jgi:hypothetical protein
LALVAAIAAHLFLTEKLDDMVVEKIFAVD